MTGIGSCKRTQDDDGLTGGSIMKELVFQKNDVIFKQGQFQSTMFDIGKGCVGIYANYGEADEKQLATFGPEQVFGEMGMIESLPRSATAVALEDETVVYEIDEEEFSSYFRDKPAKVFLIMKQLSQRIRETNRNYLDVCRTIYEAREAAEKNEKKTPWIEEHLKFFYEVYRNFGRVK